MNNYMKTVVAGIKNWVSTQFDKNKPDWTVNDENDPRYVKGRTHWEEETTAIVEFMPEETLSFGEYGYAQPSVVVELVIGQSYTVVYDGVSYECIAQDGGEDMGNAPVIGDGTLFGLEGHGEPFLYMYRNRYSAWYALTGNEDSPLETNTTHTVSISGPKTFTTIVKLSEKFLPEYDFAGQNVSGKLVTDFNGNEYIGGQNAERFNDANIASGNYSFAEGCQTKASGDNSHAEGYATKASSKSQHVQGKHNIEDTNTQYAHIVGNGTSNTARSNAHTIDWNGLGWFAGGLKVGGTGQDDTNAVEVATLANAEDWIFTLEDGSTVTKKVVLG